MFSVTAVQGSIYVPYFSGRQDDVFIPAYLLALLAAAVISIPIIFGPVIARMSARVPIFALFGLGTAAAIVAAVVVAAPGFTTIAAQRASVGSQIQDVYGLHLQADEVTKLLNGDMTVLPEVAAKAEVHFVRVSSHHYVLIRSPQASTRALQLPVKD